MTAVISFVGNDDPFTGSRGTKPGPILSLLEQRSFDVVYLLTTPASSAAARATRAAIGRRGIESRIVLVSTGLEDADDVFAAQAVLFEKWEFIRSRQPRDTLFGFVTPGTAQTHAAWLWLVERERDRLRLLELHIPRWVSAERPLVREIAASRRAPVDFHLRPSRDARDYVRSMERMAEAEHVAYARSLHSIEEDQGPDLAMAPAPAPAASVAFDMTPPDRVPTAVPDYLRVAREMGIIGDDPSVREMLYTASRYARAKIPVLITGETGTGKDLLARYVHRMSTRSECEYVTMNCAAITDTLAESELFGVKKGAYTGADGDRDGKFSAADGGTLFLDEIGDLSPDIQAKLLRALENGEIQRVGEAKARSVDVRVIAATNRDLHAAVKEKSFRDDLLSRLSVGVVHVPPLRERRGDIPAIALQLLDNINRNEGSEKQFTPRALQLLTTSSWQRWNVRELRTAIERAWTMAERGAIDYHHFKILETPSDGASDFPLPELTSDFRWHDFVDRLRTRLFARALELAGGNASAAARLLGVSPQAVSQFQGKSKSGGA